jgi:hypothetical protein
MEPLMSKPLIPRLEARLVDIKRLLEEGPGQTKADAA